MNKLPLEWLRLYVPDDRHAAPEAPALVDAEGRVRAMVLSLSKPADWAVLAQVWQGVQADLELPAPAIAVSGTQGFQLWFSLAEPVPATRAVAFLEALRRRYLGEVRIERVAAMPTVDAALPTQVRHAAPVPAPLAGGDRWSAFVAPDLAPVFGDEPWLDTPPNPEGQAELLARLKRIPIADFERALALLRPPTPAVERATPREDWSGATDPRSTPAGDPVDPRRFLHDVMNDRSVALALRIEAAKALLPGGAPDRSG